MQIQVLLDRPKVQSPNAGANIRTAQALQRASVPVRCLSITQALHVKLIIIDKTTLFAGSHNLTNSSLYSPFELTFETTDPFLANSATLYFECLWNGHLSEDFFSVVKGMTHGNR